ncbi:efflux RND transporter periplasmic adaptor subunit [Rhodobacterales bacterium HKCCE3408]|nr:efflux RND transporter periplasmic adaptor subunit [Rhodobacterales bacterium HKCCE3408]
MTRARIVLLLVVIVAGAVALWTWRTPPEVSVTPAGRGTAAEVVYATGVVEPVSWARVASLVGARIVELCGCEGDAVGEGDVLARLDARAAEARLAELLARQDYIEQERDRLRELAASNVGTRSDLERAESEALQIEAEIAGQRTVLDTYILRAPIDGMILRQEGEVGEIADPGEVLYWIGQPAPLRVVAEINEEDIPKIAVGQSALLRSDAFPDRELTADVQGITPMGDPVSRTYRVTFALPGDTPLLIGMNVEVNVIVEAREDALLIPSSAIASDGSVWVVVGDQAEIRRPVFGIRGSVNTEVLDGLAEGDLVIAPAPAGLRDGARVEVVQ